MINPNFIFWDGRKIHKDVFIEACNSCTPVIVQYNVLKKEVQGKQFERLRIMLTSFMEAGKYAKGTLLLCFDGFDNDNRALSEIDEVREFIKKVVEEFKCIFYFLIPPFNEHVFVSLVDFEMVKSPIFPKHPFYPDNTQGRLGVVQLDTTSADKQFAAISVAVKEYGQTVGDIDGAQAVLRGWRKTLNL